MESLKVLPVASTAAYKALGNAINVRVMRSIASSLIGNAVPTKLACAHDLMPPAKSTKSHAPHVVDA
jgi:hypothetical protein